jgi:hypothetical protein
LFLGWLVRDIIATQPQITGGMLDLTPAAARGELDLNWDDDPRHGQAIVKRPGESFWRDARTGNAIGSHGSLRC